MDEETKQDAGQDGPANQVTVRGRLTADPVARTLPSGAQIVTVRVSVPREQTVMTRGSRQTTDWFDCTAWSSASRRRVSSWVEDDQVELTGALRRRHYRQGDGGGSRIDIEVLSAKRLSS
ncbi:MAG: single-stranded DNA-binding protein [Nocardioidaceae bacterium]|nr:single-stranded DNA-binding protein [Nocardioidaceae bacterium]